MAPKTAAKKTEKKTKAAPAEKVKGKRQPSPYILFCKEKRPELKAAHPTASFGEMGKMLGQLWSQMDEKAKVVSSIGGVSNVKFYLSLTQSLAINRAMPRRTNECF
jgi:hypothetical protein